MRLHISTEKIQMFSYFILVIVCGSFALSLPICYSDSAPPSYIDALFTTVSAVCVTGLSTLPMDIYSTTGFVVIMALIELGGLGIVCFMSLYVLAPRRRVSLMSRMVVRDFFVEDVSSDPRSILASILGITFGIELLLVFPLYFAFASCGSTRPLLDAVFHSVSAFCNAGFSTYNDSLAGFATNHVMIYTICLLIFTGGIGFTVVIDFVSWLFRKKRRISFHSRMALSVTFVLIVAGSVAFACLEANGLLQSYGWADRIAISVFSSITPRTAGFSVFDYGQAHPLTRYITILLMFIGGSPGSIAGGVKTTTFVIVLLYALRGNTDRSGINIRGRKVDTSIVEKSFSIVAKSILVVFCASGLLLISESVVLSSGEFSFFDYVFEVVSAFATVGLSAGVTSHLSVAGKLIIILTMFIGRTGIFAMAMGARRLERERFFEYPSANVLVG
jgi:trk system potassium uptake protein TrkH